MKPAHRGRTSATILRHARSLFSGSLAWTVPRRGIGLSEASHIPRSNSEVVKQCYHAPVRVKALWKWSTLSPRCPRFLTAVPGQRPPTAQLPPPIKDTVPHLLRSSVHGSVPSSPRHAPQSSVPLLLSVHLGSKMATIQTFPITFIPADSATGTASSVLPTVATGTVFTTAIASSVPSAMSTSLPAGDSALLQNLLDGVHDLNIASAALLIGLVIASLTFGVMCTKAVTYLNGKNRGGALVVGMIICMVLINLVQFVAMVAAAYSAIIIDFGNRESWLNTRMTITIQVGLVGFAASFAHTFFAFRLHAVKRSMILTMAILLFTLLQFAFAIVTVVQMAQLGFANVLLLGADDIWAECATYSVQAGINVTVAAIAYVWIQKPYVLQKYGRTTFMEEFQYWTIKSLFGAFCLSMFNAILSAIMDLEMLWLAGTFIIGNLYTLSVLLTLESDRPTGPTPTVINLARAPRSDSRSFARRSSMATLTDDTALWEDIVKAQTMKAARLSLPKETAYNPGYEKDVGQQA